MQIKREITLGNLITIGGGLIVLVGTYYTMLGNVAKAGDDAMKAEILANRNTVAISDLKDTVNSIARSVQAQGSNIVHQGELQAIELGHIKGALSEIKQEIKKRRDVE